MKFFFWSNGGRFSSAARPKSEKTEERSGLEGPHQNSATKTPKQGVPSSALLTFGDRYSFVVGMSCALKGVWQHPWVPPTVSSTPLLAVTTAMSRDIGKCTGGANSPRVRTISLESILPLLSKPRPQLLLSRGGQLPSDNARPIRVSAAERPSAVGCPESPRRLWKRVGAPCL